MNERNVMRDGWFLFATVLGIGAALTVFVSFLGKVSPPREFKPAKLAPVNEEFTLPVPDQYATEPLDAQAYRFGYMRGQAALFTQMNKPEELLSFHTQPAQVQYTAFREAPEEERLRYEAIMSQGYIDGYHQASNGMYCPRQER